jgi:hypothetical protein
MLPLAAILITASGCKKHCAATHALGVVLARVTDDRHGGAGLTGNRIQASDECNHVPERCSRREAAIIEKAKRLGEVAGHSVR